MRRKIFENKIVRKSIVWAMTFMMAFSSVGGSMTVFAEENEVNNHVEELHLSEEYVDSSKEEYHDDEAAKVAEKSESVQAMSEQAETAKKAADAAAAEVEKVEKAVEDAKDAADTAKDAAEKATSSATDAENAASDAKNKVDALPTDTSTKVDGYNTQVAADQDVIDKIDNLEEVKIGDTVIVGTVDNGDGTTTDVTLEDYVGAQADKAWGAADEAKAKLEEALAIDTDEVTQEVLDKVEEVKEAAQKAEDAYNAAVDAKDAAVAQKDAAIELYNLYAMAYGMPKYGETEKSYSDEEAIAAINAYNLTVTEESDKIKIVYQVAEKEALDAEIKKIQDTSLAEQAAKISAADTAVGNADAAVAKAAEAAADASDVAAEAQKNVKALDKRADEAANAVNNYYVDPAKEALDNTDQAIVDKNKEIDNLNTTLTNAKEAAKTPAENAYNAELANKKKAMDDAKKAYDKCSKWNAIYKEYLRYKYNEAMDAYNNYNTSSTKNSVIANYIANDAKVKDASNKLNKAQNALTKLTAQQAEEAAVLAAAKTTRDSYIAAANEAYKNEATGEFVENIKTILAKYSAEINQIDYDEDLNDWANDVFNTWHLIDKGVVRHEMNDIYMEGNLEKLFNTLAITQWAVDTDSAEDVMDEMRKAYRESIEDYYEKMATAEANWAAMDTEAAKDAVAKEADKLTDINTTIATAKTTVEEAGDKVDAAQETYDKAAEKLKGLKDEVANCKFADPITLDALKAKIAAAEAAVLAAEDELKEAGAAKAAAENYANWAEALVTDHYTRVYAQAVEDENGNKVALAENSKNYDIENDKMQSRPVSDFISVTVDKSTVKVPYVIYRDYVEAMYEKYQATEINRGKGTSTGSNMDILYWVVGDDGNITGDYFDSIEELETGRYFVGYAFKQEGDGYHIDGIMYDYTKPEVVPTNPDTIPGGGGTTTGGGAGGGGRAAGTAGDVLGAKREDLAIVSEEGDVLGATRAPKTSDSAKAILWMLVMGSSAIGAAAVMASKKKEA